jgi:AraC-like DNA-binding protein
MKYQELDPHPALAPWVKCYWVLEDDTHDAKSLMASPVEPIHPDGHAELIFHRGDCFELARAGGYERQSRALVFGQLERSIELRAPPRVATLGVRFQPAGMAPLFGVDAAELTGGWHPLVDVGGAWAGELESRVLESEDNGEALAAIDATLRARFESARPDAVVDGVVERLKLSKGQARVGDLAKVSGLSNRQLERRFLHGVGLPPKRIAGIFRLHDAFTVLAAGTSPLLIDVAHHCGYFDQSHFIRDFRRVTGLPPSRFLREQGSMTRLFVDG